MINKIILILMLFALSLSAQLLTSPLDAMTSTYPNTTEIKKKNYLLSKSNASIISKEAKAKLSSKIFKVYIAKVSDDTIGYGILVNRKVRSKNAVVMYFIDVNSNLKSIEIIAFNEPIEYLPSDTWNSQFENIKTDTMLRVSRDIPTITGATLSARSITDGSRIAFAFYNSILKNK